MCSTMEMAQAHAFKLTLETGQEHEPCSLTMDDMMNMKRQMARDAPNGGLVEVYAPSANK